MERLRYEAVRLAVAREELERRLSHLAVVKDTLRQALHTEPGDRAAVTAAGPVRTAIRVTVPMREPGMDLTALPGIYRRLAQILQDAQVPLQAAELTRLMGLDPTPSAVEGVRAKAKRLVMREWAVQVDGGRFASS
ncbi:hypothetical protein ACWGLF_19475 [Streptomyces puniciscabiei]